MKEILDLDSGSAVTIFSFVEIPRKDPQEELGMVDLENYISQAIWKLFDSLRMDTAERLGVQEADMILTDARVMGIKIDGHQVVNPQGFTGKTIEILLGITMVRRDKFVENTHLLEGGAVRAYLLAKELDFADTIYVEVHDETTTMFSISPRGIAYINDFGWGGRDLVRSMKEEFDVQQFTADGIYNRHANGNVSDHVSRRLDRIFYNTLGEFVDSVTMSMKSFLGARSSNVPPVYLRTFFPVPEGLYRKRFQFGDKRIRFMPPVGESNLQAFVDDEVHDIYMELNNLAKRRMKWLMPTG